MRIGKRRKTRCFFESPSAPICVGCIKRGTPCISQEFIDVPSEGTSVSETATAERLKRVEAMLEKIAGKVIPDLDAPESDLASSSQGQQSTDSPDSNVNLRTSREQVMQVRCHDPKCSTISVRRLTLQTVNWCRILRKQQS